MIWKLTTFSTGLKCLKHLETANQNIKACSPEPPWFWGCDHLLANLVSWLAEIQSKYHQLTSVNPKWCHITTCWCLQCTRHSCAFMTLSFCYFLMRPFVIVPRTSLLESLRACSRSTYNEPTWTNCNQLINQHVWFNRRLCLVMCCSTIQQHVQQKMPIGQTQRMSDLAEGCGCQGSARFLEVHGNDLPQGSGAHQILCFLLKEMSKHVCKIQIVIDILLWY